jgi:hypothetical protein
MPGFLTHWRILIGTVRSLQAEADGRASLAALDSLPSLRRPRQLGDLPGADIPSLAFLGAVGPDVPYLAGSLVRASLAGQRYHGPVLGKSPWADLLHYNRSGDFICEVLRLGAESTSEELRARVALYALGYCTHIAGDIIVHPLVNRFSGAYHQQSDPGAFFSLGMHFWVELCHDAATARTFFHRRLARIWRRPWGRYLNGAGREMATRFDGMSVLDVLGSAAERVYGLDSAASGAFRREYLAGIRGMERFLSGRGYYRLLSIALLRTPDLASRFSTLEGDAASGAQRYALTFDQVFEYATLVSRSVCALALQYVHALTEHSSGDARVEETYAALRRDLRNWDLDTGYYLQPVQNEPPGSIRIMLRHSWPHFSHLREAAPDAARTE